jgi:hypothetical protein
VGDELRLLVQTGRYKSKNSEDNTTTQQYNGPSAREAKVEVTGGNGGIQHLLATPNRQRGAVRVSMEQSTRRGFQNDAYLRCRSRPD